MKKLAIGGLVTSLIAAAAVGFSLANPYAIRDWVVLRNYTPPAEVERLADVTAMSEEGRRLFYVYDPRIESASEFNTHCTVAEESIVLGCYNGRYIYLFDITDERLKGVEEVTAAHEMLHAAYDRLDEQEKARVDQLTAKALQKITNERIQNVVKSYRSRDPSVVPNELHSILGTEVRSLSPELEQYYAQYFTDRTKVVSYSESYEKIFTDLRAKVDAYDAELQLIRAQIDALEADLTTRAANIDAEQAQLEALRNSGQVAQYNARVPGFNASVNTYNSDLATYRQLIADYNAKVEVRNQASVEQNDLVEALDSKVSER